MIVNGAEGGTNTTFCYTKQYPSSPPLSVKWNFGSIEGNTIDVYKNIKIGKSDVGNKRSVVMKKKILKSFWYSLYVS